MGIGYLQVPVWLSAGLNRHAYVTGRLNTPAQMLPCDAHYYDIGHFLIHDLTYKARTLSVQTCEPGDHPACQALPPFSTTQTSRRMSLARAGHCCGLVEGHAWMGSLSIYLSPTILWCLLARAQGRLAHRPKYITHSGRGEGSIDLTLKIKINKKGMT